MKDGQSFSVQGRLRIVYQGWHHYLVIDLKRPALADFRNEEDGLKRIEAVELNPQGNWSLIARHAGEIVGARGKLQIDSSSPYYWNGVMLMAEETKLPDGTVLRPDLSTVPQVPATVNLYLVTFTMLPHQFDWPRTAINLKSHQPLPHPDLDGCGLNGGGDVMNCVCVTDFSPVRAGVVAHPVTPDHWAALPKAHDALPGMAQFVLPDPDARRPLIVQVACQRNAAGAR